MKIKENQEQIVQKINEDLKFVNFKWKRKRKNNKTSLLKKQEKRKKDELEIKEKVDWSRLFIEKHLGALEEEKQFLYYIGRIKEIYNEIINGLQSFKDMKSYKEKVIITKSLSLKIITIFKQPVGTWFLSLIDYSNYRKFKKTLERKCFPLEPLSVGI